VYPAGCSFEDENAQSRASAKAAGREHRRSAGFHHEVYTFLSPLVWSPDSNHMAVVAKVFDWEYTDPYNGYFGGSASTMRYYAVVASRDGSFVDYPLSGSQDQALVHWNNPNELVVNGETVNLAARSGTAAR
jgi:hypothetical protein